MYRLDDVQKIKALEHYEKYKDSVVKAIGEHLKMVPKGSYAWTFLNMALVDGYRLRVLLMGDFEEQKVLIKDVDKDISKLAATDAKAEKTFITEMKKLFVDGMYDNSDMFSKSDHVKRVDIEICPYCGRSYIYYADHPTRSNPMTMVKPAIDHFLPKDVYPYLAMNYYNLIPACTTCNNSPCKWTNDPIGTTRNQEYLIHPYAFDERRIKFRYKPTARLYNKRYITVLMDCENTELDTGYKTWLNLDQFYAKHNGLVKNMYVRLASLQKSYQTFTGRSFRIPNDFIDKLPQIVFGYKLSPERAKEELMYKFKKDIYYQMRKQLYNI